MVTERRRVTAGGEAKRDMIRVDGLRMVYPGMLIDVPSRWRWELLAFIRPAVACGLLLLLPLMPPPPRAGRAGAPPKVAVKGVHFGVAEGTCFGFLGINVSPAHTHSLSLDTSIIVAVSSSSSRCVL